LLRFKEDQQVTIEVTNRTDRAEVVHWHGLFNSTEVDGALEEGTPALERTLHGPDVNQGFGFAPSAKISYDFTRIVSGGVEWYADYGAIGDIAPIHNQQQQVFLVTDLNVCPCGRSISAWASARPRPPTI
jgi:hypothetical protein